MSDGHSENEKSYSEWQSQLDVVIERNINELAKPYPSGIHGALNCQRASKESFLPIIVNAETGQIHIDPLSKPIAEYAINGMIQINRQKRTAKFELYQTPGYGPHLTGRARGVLFETESIASMAL